MGSGIAQVALAHGLPVVLVDTDPASLERARDRIGAGLRKAADKGALALSPDDCLAGLSTGTALAATAGCELVIEAVPEILSVKLEVLAALSQLSPDLVIATNTSSLPISTLAKSVSRPERFLGVHFFNPVPVLPLVELISHDGTDSRLVQQVADFLVEALGKEVVRCADRPGFVVNALLIPYLCSAISLLESGAATAEDIDRAMVFGCSHPMGPLALSDLIGLDTVAAIAQTLADESGNPHLNPPALLRSKVANGELGRKSGRGFFEY